MQELSVKTVRGKRRVTVELEDDELLLAIVPEAYYRTGDPHDDIVQGNHIANSTRVVWCVVEQQWRGL